MTGEKLLFYLLYLDQKFFALANDYQGTTIKCLPKHVEFLDDWHITYITNHWANKDTTIAFIENIIIPYVKKESCLALVMITMLWWFDVFKGQCTSKVLKLLEENNYATVEETAQTDYSL